MDIQAVYWRGEKPAAHLFRNPTNAEGIALFEGLQTQSYYVPAYATLGTNLVSTWNTDTLAAAAQRTKTLPEPRIKLQ